MRIKSLVFGLILALSGQFAFAADCAGDLRPAVTAISFGLHIHIVIDPQTGQPRIEYVDGGNHMAPTPRAAPVPAARPPRQERAVPRTLGAHFQALMKSEALIHQSDRRLGQRDLLTPNGGLCGSTCGVNVVHAAMSYLTGQAADFADNADYYIHRIVDETRKTFGKDAREGLTLPDLAAALRFLAEELKITIYADYDYPRADRALRIQDLETKENEIVIASVRKGWRDGKPAYHAIVITDVDTEHNMVSYSDPNFPNSGNRVKAFEAYDRNGNVTVLLMAPASPGADGFEGMVNDILRVRVAKR